jgi:hypothetical protein
MLSLHGSPTCPLPATLPLSHCPCCAALNNQWPAYCFSLNLDIALSTRHLCEKNFFAPPLALYQFYSCATLSCPCVMLHSFVLMTFHCDPCLHSSSRSPS